MLFTPAIAAKLKCVARTLSEVHKLKRTSRAYIMPFLNQIGTLESLKTFIIRTSSMEPFYVVVFML